MCSSIFFKNIIEVPITITKWTNTAMNHHRSCSSYLQLNFNQTQSTYFAKPFESSS